MEFFFVVPESFTTTRPRAQSHLIAAQAEGHFALIEQTAGLVCPEELPLRKDAICAQLMRFFARYPMRAATKFQAAVHEAGHFVIFEREFLIAFDAKIYGTPFGRDGWGGGAQRERVFDRYCANDADHLLNEARAALAGPIAEELLARGDVHGSIGELVEARMLVDRAAELHCRDESELWRESLIEAVAMVKQFTNEIQAIAGLLERRKRVSRYQPAVKKVLEHVTQKHAATRSLSHRGMLLAQKIDAALKELAR